MIPIESLEATDVEEVCALARLVWRAHYPPIIGSAQTEYMLAQRYEPAILLKELEHDDIWWDVLRRDGEIVAFASAIRGPAPDELKIDKLYVHPAHQRRGHGGALIGYNCKRALKFGLRCVVLAVNKHNRSAIAAYRKHGFAIREAVVKDIGSGYVMDDYIMARTVTANADERGSSFPGHTT